MVSIIWMILILTVGGVIRYSKDKAERISVPPAEVVPAEKTPVISEPVTSFIKCFKDNPRRFKVTRTDDANWWTLKDSVTEKEWVFTASKGIGILSWYHSIYIAGNGYDWLTDDEGSALYLAMYPYFGVERRDRLHTIQRERLTRIYKESADV